MIAAAFALVAALVLVGGSSAAGWTKTKRLSVGATDAGAPWVAVGPNGTMTVAWEQEVGSISVVRARRWSATGKPGPLLKLSPAGQNVGVVRVGTAESGVTFVMWLNQGIGRIQIRRIAPSGRLGPIRNVSPAAASAGSPDLAVAPDGRAIVSWLRFDGGSSWTILARRVGANGRPAATTATVGTANSYPQATAVSIAPNGIAFVAWQATDGSKVRVWARRIAASGSLGGVLPALSDPGQDASFVRVASAGNGTATVAWQRSNGTNQIAQARRVAPNGTLGPVLDLSAPGQNGTAPALAVSRKGVAIVAWERSNGTNVIVQTRRIAANGAVGAVRDRSAAGQSADGVTVGGAPSGTVFVAWHRYNGTNTMIQAVRITPKGKAGPVKNASSGPQESNQWASVAVSSTGIAAAAWYASAGSYDAIYASRYFPDRPNTRITGASISSAARSASFTLRGSGGAGKRTFQCRLRGAGTTGAQRAWSRCGSPKRYTNLPYGSLVFEARARDESGRVDTTPAKRAFRIG